MELIQHLSFDRRQLRLAELSECLQDVLRTEGSLELVELLQLAGKRHREPIGELKFGLTYAKSRGSVRIDSYGRASLIAE